MDVAQNRGNLVAFQAKGQIIENLCLWGIGWKSKLPDQLLDDPVINILAAGSDNSEIRCFPFFINIKFHQRLACELVFHQITKIAGEAFNVLRLRG